MRLDCPLRKRSCFRPSRMPSSSTCRSRSLLLSYDPPELALAASCSREAASTLGRFRCRRPSKASAKLSTSSSCVLPPSFAASLEDSTSRPIGSFFRRKITEYGSAALTRISSRNLSSSSGPTVRVFPNHRRSGAIRPVVASISLPPARLPITYSPPTSTPCLFRIPEPLRYMFRMLIFALVRASPPLTLAPDNFRFGFDEALPTPKAVFFIFGAIVLELAS
mmetsp:Transcript_852/g.1858  ORF Transcript_852/g.1858 Transcript_852/m.1858 type:complete len:222 (-) Transcript_852:60-725(-)